MYTGLLHSHKLFVLLFLIHYIVKLVLLLTNKNEQLAKYTKATKIPEIVISVAFLVTGGWMLFNNKTVSSYMIIKLVCVFSSIPLAVIGFKKGNKVLAFVAVFLIIMSYGLAEMNKKAKTGPKVDTSAITNPIEAGKLIYTNSCATCHGTDGKKNANGAKDLSITVLTAAEQKELIRNGKNAMPGYKDLTDEQLDGVVQYVATLKQ
ncbi:MAG TPA: c-type cytochrome [Chitinophagales bacterium]|nr:c-type cytochrome [Chitinophagales bacterium]